MKKFALKMKLGMMKMLSTVTEKKEAGVKAIIVEIILLVVAAAICILFKNEIMSVINSLLSQVSDKVSGIFN